MNLTTSLLALAGHNLTYNPAEYRSYHYCNEFYGPFPPTNRDCFRAASRLDSGATDVSYTVHSGSGPDTLPFSKTYGTCMVQVDLAGPRLPQTFSYSPSEIRRMAFNLLDGCVIPDKVGGFITSDLKDMQNYLTADGIRLNRPFRTSRLKTLILAYNSRQGEISNTLLGRRLTLETLPATSTAFLTVTVSSIVPEWLSPGDFDPIVPHQLAWVVGAAAEKELDQRKRVDLRWRELKLDQRIPKMTPRGGRVAWWDFSDLGEEPDGTSLDTGDQMGPVDTLEPLASSASSTTSRRRRSRR